jgi:hypothetical protein
MDSLSLQMCRFNLNLRSTVSSWLNSLQKIVVLWFLSLFLSFLLSSTLFYIFSRFPLWQRSLLPCILFSCVIICLTLINFYYRGFRYSISSVKKLAINTLVRLNLSSQEGRINEHAWIVRWYLERVLSLNISMWWWYFIFSCLLIGINKARLQE